MPAPPRWLRVFNRIVVGMRHLGLAMGPVHVLTLRGRRSGRPRTTPVSPLTVDGKRYVVGGFANGDWVANARASGDGVLARGRRTERVRLVEVSPEERIPVMRAFPVEVPGGVPMLRKAGIVDGATPDAFERGASKVAVFRIDPR